MSFVSWTFLCLFLPAFLLVWRVVSVFRKDWLELVLVLFSLVFVASCSCTWLCLLLGITLLNYALGMLLSSPGDEGFSCKRGLTLCLACSINLVPFVLFRRILFSLDPPLLYAPGLAFWVLMQIGWLISIYRREIEPEGLLRHLSFSTAFPWLLAGPLVRYEQIGTQFDMLPQPSEGDSARGVVRICLGLAKKLLIADTLALASDAVFSAVAYREPLSCLDAWLGLFAFSFQIYFDFSACIDIAIGLALLIGIHLPENFHSPYRASGFIEFWRRWHISFSSWLRNYLYLPLGGSWFGKWRQFLIFTFCALVAGLWHGLALTFVVWGGLHALFLFINFVFRAIIRGRGIEFVFSLLPIRICCTCLTFLLVSLSWVVFRSSNLWDALIFYSTLAGHPFIPSGAVAIQTSLFPSLLSFLPLCVAGCIVFLFPCAKEFVDGKRDGERPWLSWNPSLVWAMLLAVLTCAAVFFIENARPFIF